MGNRFFASSVVFVSFLCVASGLPAQDATEGGLAPVASIEQTELPAAGRHGTTFRVPTFGRWSVALASERGVALQLVDRVSGPGEVVGTAGERDGRLDLFLDRGEYKVFSLGPEARDGIDLGTAELRVEPFREIEERTVTLPDLARVSTRLGDLEQVSWWLQIDRTQRVAFEAAGRHLEDLRLWRDGTWMFGAEPSFERVEPVVGRPLTICRLASELPPGLYRLTAYGGAGLPWADDDGTRPLFLRSGVDRRGEAGRSGLEVSEYGIDRFVVPASASFVRLEVPDGDLRQQPVSLEVGEWREEAPYDADGAQTSTVHKELRELAAEQFHGVDEGTLRVITVRGMAGQPYVLQHFRSQEVYHFSEAGEFWIDTVHSGHPADSAEATGMLLDFASWDRYQTPLRTDTVQLRRGEALDRRFNLPEAATLFLEVLQPGRYEVTTSGVDADVRLEPYARPDRPQEGERPPTRSGGGVWDLDRGYYVLSLEPRSQGIVDLTLRDADAATHPAAGPSSGAAPTARLGRVFLEKDHSYLFHLNHQPGVQSGVVLRPLPLDLSQPLPFVVGRGGADRTLTVPFRVPGEGFLRAVTEDGVELHLSEGGAATADASVGWTTLPVSGSGTVTVTPPENLELPAAASLAWVPKHRREPLPELPAGTLDALPELPTLTARREEFLRLGRGSNTSYLVRAEEAGLYRLESTGLLDTAGVLRTRVMPEVERVDDEGTGRNFLIQRYLGAGEYQLTVESRGRSAGHLGLRLAAAPVRPAGRLEPGIPARGWIDPGESLEYRFDVPEAGRWSLRILGLGDSFPVRIEDAAGWPLTRPGLPGDQTVALDAGEHRLVVLPRAVRSRHLALVSPLPEPPDRSGHGPFDLTLEEQIEHVWSGDAAALRDLRDDEPLPPDRWRFRLSAEVGLDVELGRDVVAELVRVAPGGEQVVGEITALRGLDDDVPAGDYELRVRPARRNNRVDYELRVVPRQLLPGHSTRVSVPGNYELRVGETSLVEIASLGAVDVRARLTDAAGHDLAQSDDRPGDWNLRLVRRLDPGTYRVQVATTGDGGRVDLAVSTLEEIEKAPLAIGRGGVLSASLVPGRSVHLWPLDPSSADGARPAPVLLAQAESEESSRLTVETRGADGRWQGVAWGEGAGARVAYAAASGESLRLRLEALGRGSSEVRVRARWAGDTPSGSVDESRLERGVRVPDDLGGRGVVAVRLTRPGCFDVRDLPEGSSVAGFVSTALRPAPDLAAGDEMLLLEAAAGSTVRVARWSWPAGAEASPRRLRLTDGERARCDLAPSDRTRLLSARGLGGAATLVVGDGGAQASDGTLGGATALALALPRSGQAAIGWSGPPDAVGEVELTAQSFGEGPPAPAPARVDLDLGIDQCRLYALPAGSQRLRLGLGAGSIAAVTSGRSVEFLHRAPAGGVEIVRDVDVASQGAAYLRLCAGGLVTMTRLDLGAPPSVVAADEPLERALDRAGRLDVDVAAGASATSLQVRGADRVLLLGADGSVDAAVAGADASATVTVPAAGGRLVIDHGPGAVVAWLGDGVEGLVPDGSLRAMAVGVPSARRLEPDGLAATVDLERPSVLHLRAPTAGVSMVRAAGGGEPWAGLHLDDLAVDAWLPAGRSEFRIRPLAGHSFGGTLEATASEVLEIGEGLGPEILLGPGDERWASFVVERPGDVGVAVRADAEVASVRLLNAQGRALGDSRSAGGVLHMARLEPGRYLLALRLGAEHPPVRVRPVVVGLEPPTGPPEEVVRRYLELAGVTGGADEAEGGAP